jgi:hypothetical protein
VTSEEARSVLGVAPEAGPRAVRDAFLRRVREMHPDVTDHPEGAAERTATVIAAYRMLRDAPPDVAPDTAPTTSATPAPPPRAPARVEVITEEAIWVDAAPGAVARALLLVADDLGEVSYVDRSGGLVQLTVRPTEGPTCWLTVSAHARPGGTVLVATLESIEAAPTPPAGPLVAALAQAMATALGGGPDIPVTT